MRPDAILFDCYGTLLTIADRRDVTRRYARLAGRLPGPSPLTTRITLADALRAHGVAGTEADAIEADARAEADSVETLPGALEALALAGRHGVGVAIVSNLSVEYAEPIGRLIPGIPAVLSFEEGVAKPDLAIFGAARGRLGAGGAVAMIGDSRRSDHDGATVAGLTAVLLAPGPVEDVVTAPTALDAVRLLLGCGGA